MKNQQQNAPLEYYRAKYRKLDPQETKKHTNLHYDAEKKRFTLETLNQTIYAEWPEYKLTPANPEHCPKELGGFAMQILAIRYLTEGAQAPAKGTYKAYRELPWGETYDANFQGRCIKRLAHSFGTKIKEFEKAAETLGGKKQTLGDSSYDLPFLGGVTCRLILWAPEEEFPPSAQILFSDNTPAAFNAEDLAALGDVLVTTLKEVTSKTLAISSPQPLFP